MRHSIGLLIARHRGLAAVTALQAICAVFFLGDILTELPDFRTAPLHPSLELVAVAVFWIGSLWGASQLAALARRTQRIEAGLQAATGAFLELLEESFTRWGLTPSERDVALLAIKGLSIAEIARLRATRDGTVKAQCAAVYRKAGVTSRAQLLSVFIEELMAGVVLEGRDEPSRGAA